MATTLYFTRTASDYQTGNNDAKLDGTTQGWESRALSLTALTSVSASSTTTVAGPTNGLEAATAADPAALIWYSAPLAAAATISGSVTWNLWASEVNMTDNVAINGRLEVIDGATGAITLIDQTARVTEVAQTTRTVNNFAETPAAGVACKKGDRLRVRVFGDDLGATAMGAGGSFAFGYAGTVAQLGESWLQVTENLSFVSEPAGSQVFLTDTASAVDVSTNVASLLSAFTGSDEDPLSEGGNWANLNSAYTAHFNRTSNAIGPSAAAQCGSYWTPANFGPDVEAYMTVTTMGAPVILARVQGEGGSATFDGYGARVNSSSVQLSRYDNALATTTLGTFLGTFGDGTKVGITCHGNTIEAWYQVPAGAWTLAVSATDTTYPSAGKVAVLSTSGSAVRVDDIYVGTNVFYSFRVPIEREAWTSRGGGVQTDVTNTAAGWTAPIQVTDTAGGTVVDWFTKPLVAMTLSGAVRCNVRASVSVGSTLAQVRCEIARVAGDGTSPTVWASGVPYTTGAALSTTEAAVSYLVSGTDLAITDGQRLRVRLYIDEDGTTPMVASRTLTLYYAGAAAATGDTYVTFTQTLTEYVTAATTPPRTSQYPSLIAQ